MPSRVCSERQRVQGRHRDYWRNPLRRFDLPAGVGLDEGLAAAQRLRVEMLQVTPGVLADPPPQALVEGWTSPTW
jgi:hypothetical protein